MDIIIVSPASCVSCPVPLNEGSARYAVTALWKIVGERLLFSLLSTPSLVTARMILQLDRCLTCSQSLDR